MLALRVELGDTGQIKGMRFGSEMSGKDVAQFIVQEHGVGNESWGLFQADVPGVRKARWLKTEKTLGSQDLRSGDVLHWQSRERPIKVKLLDGTQKVVMIDDSESVEKLLKVIGEKIGLDDVEEYGLLIDGTETWLNQMQSIQDQGVNNETVLQFEKRFFVDDDNVDKSDQKKLLLVFYQAQRGVMEGKFPLTSKEAVLFAAISLQIQTGDFSPESHDVKWVRGEADKILPKAHHKKKLESAILDEYKKLVGQQKVDCYFKYVTFCRQLPTYGITTYLVREKIEGKRKLQDVLLGITRDRIVFMDPETKEIRDEYPLDHLRRWAAAKTSFTLDFGTYLTDYISLQTTQGDAISELIAGYIDILLRRRQAGKILHDDDGALMAELEELGPLVAIPNVSHVSMAGVGKYSADDFRVNELMPASMGLNRGRAGGEGMRPESELMNAAQQAQRAIGLLDDRFRPGAAMSDLPPDLRDDLLAAAHRLGKAVNDMLRDPAADGPARTVSDNLMALIDAARKAAAATHDPTLLDASKRVAQAVADLLKAQAELEANPNDAGARKRLEDAVRRLKGAAAYLNGALNGLLTDPNSEQLLLESARQVADALKRLAGNANKMDKDKLGPAARKAAGSGNTLAENSQMLAPLINDPNARQQLLDLAKDCADDAQGLMSAAERASLPESQLGLLAAAAKAVNDSLAQMLNSVDCASSRAAQNQEQMADAAQKVMDALNHLKKAQGKPRDIQQATQEVGDAVPLLMQAAKRAAVNDPQNAAGLLEAARRLAVAAKDMMGRAALSCEEPENTDKFRGLLMSAQQVAQATRALLGEGAKFSIFTTVRSKAKAAAAACTGLANVSRAAVKDCKGRDGQVALHKAAQDTTVGVAQLVEALKGASLEPDSLTAQAKLVDVAKQVAKPLANAVNSSRKVTPEVTDVASKQALKYATKDAGTALSELAEACSKAAGVTGERDVDEALESFAATQEELNAARLDAEVGALVSPASREQGVADLKQALSTLVEATNELKAGKPVGPNAKRAAAAMAGVANGSKAIAANTAGADNQKAILDAAGQVIPNLEDLIKRARARALDPNEDALSLLDAAKQVSNTMRELLRTTQKGTGAEECQEAAEAIEASLNRLQMAPAFQPGDIVALSSEVENRAKAVAMATHQLQQISRDPASKPEALKESAVATASAFPSLITAVNRIAAACKDRKAQDEILRATQVMGTHVAKVCNFASTAKVDEKSAANVQKAHRNVVQSVRGLLDALTKATPGIAELEKAAAMLSETAALKEALPAGDYNLRTLNQATSDLGDAAVKLVQAARTEPENLGKHAVQTARAMADVMNNSRGFSPAAQAKSGSIFLTQTAQRMQPMPKPEVADVKAMAVTTQQVVNACKSLVQAEDEPTRQAMSKTMVDRVQPALQQLIASAKDLGKPEGPPAVKKAAVELADAVRQMLEPCTQIEGIPELLQAAQALTTTTQGMVDKATNLAKKPGDQASIQAITGDGQQLGEQMRAFKAATKRLAPGHVECEAAHKQVQDAVRQLDAAQMSAAVGVLEVVPDKTHQGAQEEMVKIARRLAEAVQAMQESVHGQDWVNVGQAATDLAAGMEDATATAIDVAGTTTNQTTQISHLDQVKQVGEHALQLSHIGSELTADNASEALGRDLLSTADDLRHALQALLQNLKGGVVGLRACDEAIATIHQAQASLNSGPQAAGATGGNYAECQRALVSEAQSVAVNITQLFQVAKTEPAAVGEPSKALAEAVSSMARAALVAAGASQDADTREALILGATEVTGAAIEIISASKKVATDPDNQLFGEELIRSFQSVTERVTGLIRSVREGATGERDCKDAISSIRRTVAEIDAVSVYVATGEYEAKDADVTIDLVYDELLDSEQAMNKAVRAMQPASAAGQAKLGSAAKDTADCMARLGDLTKLMAGISSDVVAQSDALAGTKSVGTSAQAVVQAALAAQAHAGDAGKAQALQARTGECVAALAALRQHVSTSMGPAATGVRHLAGAEKRVRAAAARIAEPGAMGNQGASPEDIVVPLRVLDANILQLTSITGTQGAEVQELSAKMALAYEQVAENALGCCRLTNAPAVKANVIRAVEQAGAQLALVLELSKEQRKDKQAFQDDLLEATEAFTGHIQDVVEASRGLPGGEDLELKESKLESQATDELLAAAKIIEAAAAMLMNAPQRMKDPSAELDEDDIAGGILEAARKITQETFGLIKASIAAQREIQSKGGGTKSANAYRADPAWAEGLISAAKAVAQTTQDLVFAANATVKQEMGEEAVVATSRMVQGATARLVAASKAKLDLGSPNQDPLNKAASGVTAATKELGAAAKQAFEFSVVKNDQTSGKKLSAMAARRAEIESQEAVNKAQRELDKAFRRLKARRRQEYAAANAAASAARTKRPSNAAGAKSPALASTAAAARRPSTGVASQPRGRRGSSAGRGRGRGGIARGVARGVARGRAAGGRGRGAAGGGRGRGAAGGGRGRGGSGGRGRGGAGRASPAGRGGGK